MYSIDITYYTGIVNPRIIWALWPEGALLTSRGGICFHTGVVNLQSIQQPLRALWPEGALLTSRGGICFIFHFSLHGDCECDGSSPSRRCGLRGHC